MYGSACDFSHRRLPEGAYYFSFCTQTHLRKKTISANESFEALISDRIGHQK